MAELLDVQFGSTFLSARSDDAGEAADSLYAFRYSQKPQSLDATSPGTLSSNPANPAAMLASFPSISTSPAANSASESKEHWFTATQAPAKEVECVLIWDEECQCYTLERLDSNVKLLHERTPRTPFQHQSLSLAPTPPTTAQPVSPDHRTPAPPKASRKPAGSATKSAAVAPSGNTKKVEAEIEDFGDVALAPSPSKPIPSSQPRTSVATSGSLALPAAAAKLPTPTVPSPSVAPKSQAPAAAPLASTASPSIPSPSRPVVAGKRLPVAAAPPAPPGAGTTKRAPPKPRTTAPATTAPTRPRRKSSASSTAQSAALAAATVAATKTGTALATSQEKKESSEEDDDDDDSDSDSEDEESGPEGYIIARPGSVLSRNAVASSSNPPPTAAPGQRAMKSLPSHAQRGMKTLPTKTVTSTEPSDDSEDDSDDDEEVSEDDVDLEALASNINATLEVEPPPAGRGLRRKSSLGQQQQQQQQQAGKMPARPTVGRKGPAPPSQAARPSVGRKGPAPPVTQGRVASKGVARKGPAPVQAPVDTSDDEPESSEED